VYRRVTYRLNGRLALLAFQNVVVGNPHDFELTPSDISGHLRRAADLVKAETVVCSVDFIVPIWIL